MMTFDINDPDIKARTVARNQLAFSFLSYQPIVPGHLVICPIRCVVTSEELTPEEWTAILNLKSSLCDALKTAFGAQGFNFAWNMGAEAGQTVPHFHLHVVPRRAGDTGILEYEPRVFLYRPGSRAITPTEELSQIAQLLQQHLVP
jgi:diadenosine tetraphosphate (Ap4A) HIT family hydrolase